MPRIRGRPCDSAEAWRSRIPVEHAVANNSRRQGEGPRRVARGIPCASAEAGHCNSDEEKPLSLTLAGSLPAITSGSSGGSGLKRPACRKPFREGDRKSVV